MKLTLFSGVLLMLFFSSSAHAQITQKFLVVNNTGTALSAVYISPSGSNSWGYNILAKERMINNESFDFIKNIDKESCFYEVRFLDQNGKEYFIKSLDLCNISLITLSTFDNTKKAIKKE